MASVPGKTKDLEEPQGLNCEPCATLAATFILAITKSLAFVYAFFMGLVVEEITSPASME